MELKITPTFYRYFFGFDCDRCDVIKNKKIRAKQSNEKKQNEVCRVGL